MTVTPQPPCAIPDTWYNLLADFPLDIPDDLPSPYATARELRPQLPADLIRQELSRKRDIAIPGPVMDRYTAWRPTPLTRARALERALDTPARIYYKYEGGNVSGSHKLNTAVAQAHYYAKAGARRLVTGTGAGQWGTAMTAAGAMFGLETTAYMTRNSYDSKPYRRVAMEMLGGRVVPVDGNMSVALAAALAEASGPDTRFCTGSGEGYSILHQTVIGREALRQLEGYGDRADVVVASLGAGSNFGGLAFPFLAEGRNGNSVRAVAVEPAACPKLTRGQYRYDFTDASGQTPMQKMYTLGHRFTTPDIHAGGLRYHATAKIISRLYHERAIEATACTQNEAFASAVLFARLEGIIPAPEAAHAVHGAVREAIASREEGTPRVIVFCLSGHGIYDMTAYEQFQSGSLEDVVPTDDDIASSLAQLPPQPAGQLG